MDKYYVTQITKTKDSSTYATAITVKDTLTDAKMLYHQILASVYANTKIEHAIVKIDDYFGNAVLMEAIIPAEPEPNEEEGE